MGKTGYRRHGFWALAALALLALFVQACSDNTGTAGPRFPAATTGASDGGVIVGVFVNPNSVEVNRRAGITVLAKTPNGFPLEGRRVQVGTSLGRVDPVDGFTDGDGKFVTFLFCDQAGSAVLSVFVEGAASLATATVLCGGGTPTTTPTAEPS